MLSYFNVRIPLLHHPPCCGLWPHAQVHQLLPHVHPFCMLVFSFSGLSEADFVGVETDLAQVQEELLRLFSSNTILIGHSLESDLEALKVS